MKCNHASFESDRPQIKVLSREKIEIIHEASLEILKNTGVSVRLPEAVELLATAGCDVEGDLVKIPRRIVEACLDMAPDRIDVYDRLENIAMQLEGCNSYFGTGPTIQYVMDPETGEHRDSTMEDIEAAARIVDYLPNLDFCMTMGMAGGVNPQTAGLNPLVTDRYDFAAMLIDTTKPLMFSNWSLEGLKDCYQMALAARDGDEKSFLTGIPVDEETLAVEAIKEQGAGGSFIAHQHTLDHFRYIWHPRLFDRGNRESWEMAGSHDLGARLNQKVKEILKTHQPEPLSESVKAQMGSILANAKAQYPADK